MSGPVRAVLLDVDDTLLDTTTAMLRAGRLAMAAVWPGREEDWYASAAVRFRTDPEGFFGRYTRGELSFGAMREMRLAAVADASGVVLPSDAIEVYEHAFRPAFEQAQQVFPDVRPFLDRCADRGLLTAALTNSAAEVTARKLAATGAEDWFTVVITRDSLGFGKPDRRVFLHACAELGTDPAETVCVGDELEADVLGASRAGLRPVWVRRAASVPGEPRPHEWVVPADLPPGTLQVADLTTLPDALDLGSPSGGR